MIGKNLRFLREERGMSQTALAEALELKRGNISSYEKEHAQPNIQTIIKISEFFKVSLEPLLKHDLESEGHHDESLLEKFSHNKLVKGIKEKISNFQISHKADKIVKLKAQNDEIMKMISGFKAFHEYRMDNFSMKQSDIDSLSHDYMNLLSLMSTLLKTNKELIRLAEG